MLEKTTSPTCSTFRLQLLSVFLLFVFLVSCLEISAQQRRHHIWLFGQNAGINFNSGSAVNYIGGLINTTEGCATICDSITGALLFYTDGSTVWSNNHTVMANGTGLTGNGTTTQSAIILPQPLNPGIFYVFSVPFTSGTTDLAYSIVDLNQNGGLGAVTTKNVMMASGPTICEKSTAIQHCNGIDWWFITHQFGSNNYLSWLLTSTGLAGAPVVSGAGTVISGTTTGKIGYLTASNDGTKLAFPIYNGGTCDVVDFDNLSGTVSNPIILTGFAQNYGTCFSPNNQVLYVTNFQTLRQFDLSSGVQATIQASMINIITESNWMRAMRLGPDNRIYVAREFQPFMGIIQNPNALGTACSYTPIGLNLAPNRNTLGVTNTYPNDAPSCIILSNTDIKLKAQSTDHYSHQLDWQIETDQDLELSSLQIQRRTSDTQWQTLHQIETGTAGSTQSYSYHPIQLKPYEYRLIMRDQAGSYHHSNTAELNAAPTSLELLSLFPNPATDLIQIDFIVPHDRPLKLNLIDGLGRVAYTHQLSGFRGRQSHVIDTDEIAAGVYLLNLTDGLDNQTRRVVIR